MGIAKQLSWLACAATMALATTTAEAAVKSADAALPKLRQNVTKTEPILKKANDTLQKAKAALAKKPKDKNSAKQVATAHWRWRAWWRLRAAPRSRDFAGPGSPSRA